jgi:3-oxoacyl-[acyl-carrier protein] reductase
MADRYSELTNSPIGGAVSKRLGLPVPPRLERHRPGKPAVDGTVLVGGAHRGRLLDAATHALRSFGAHIETAHPGDDGAAYAALVYDASGIEESGRLRALYEFFHPVIRKLRPNGRIVVLAAPVDAADGPVAATAQRAIEGFSRTLAKEVGGKGSTAQLVRVGAGGEAGVGSTLRFLLSARSAYVSGQVIELESVAAGDVVEPGDPERPLVGRIAAVTGASRGIGEAIAETLARDGAEVLAIDVPAAGAALSEVANRIGGSALQLDITDSAAPQRLADHIAERHGKLDAIVHNAGITRDKKLANMAEDRWSSVIAVNLTAPERITRELLTQGVINENGSVVGVASIAGIAGNVGQTNYAASKAGVIGLVDSLAGELDHGITINAVAPGFIITAMTAAVPLATREVGQRLNAMSQGGLPVDVAETIAWFASPGSSAVNGNVVRVCGQMMLGA